MVSENPQVARTNTMLIILLLTVATVMKIAWAANSIGTTDIVRFFHFSELLQKQSIAEVYAADSRWNHTLTVSLWTKFAGFITAENGAAFVLLFRLPGILADVVLVCELLLLRRRFNIPWIALSFAAMSPIHLIISGFHGNLDGIMALLIFLAFSAAVRDAPAMSGLFLGLACNVKIPPVLLAPALAAYWLAHGKPWRFLAGFGATAGMMIAGGIYAAGLPFLKNVLAYGSIWGTWGIGELLVALGLSKPEVPLTRYESGTTAMIAKGLKLAIVGTTCWLAWARRRAPAEELIRTAAATLLVFFALTPGFGHQYFVWWFGPVLVVAPRLSIALASGAALTTALVFQSGSKSAFPWWLVEPPFPVTGILLAASLATWAGFACGAIFLVRSCFVTRKSDV